MDTSMEYVGDATNSTTGAPGRGPAIELIAMIKGYETGEVPIRVVTPNRPFFLQPENIMLGCPIISIPTSDFTAFDTHSQKSIPVYIIDSNTVTPTKVPQVRVILSNAIITSDTDGIVVSDPHVAICATIKALGTGSDSITLITPNGVVSVTMETPQRNFPIYRVETSAFTANDGDASIPVYLYESIPVVHPSAPSSVEIVFTDLIVTL